MELTKSLESLDAIADELLAKSVESDKSKKDTDELSPEDISSKYTPSSDEDEDESEDKVEKEEEGGEESEDESDEKEKEDIEKSCSNCKKSEDSDDEDNDDDEDSDGEESDEVQEESEDVSKQIQDDFKSDNTIKKSIEDSEFLSAVVDAFAKSMGDVQYDVQHQNRSQKAAMDVLAKSMMASIASNNALKAENEKLARKIHKLEKSISTGFDRVMDCLDEISSQPVGMRKSVASVSIQDRDFESSLNGHSSNIRFESLSKSEVLNILNNELYNGNPNVTVGDIIGYESGAPLRSDLQDFVVSKRK